MAPRRPPLSSPTSTVPAPKVYRRPPATGSPSSTPRTEASVISFGKKVVYIHGMGPHDPPPQVKKSYDQALFQVDMGDRSALAYYAQILHPFSSGGTMQRRAVIGNSVDLEAEDLLGPAALVESAGELASRKAWATQLVQTMIDQTPLALSDEGLERTLRDVGPALREARTLSAKTLPAEPIRRRISSSFIAQFVPDAATYFFEHAFQQRVRQQLRDQLLETALRGGPYVLISHGLGTIVAYDVLHELQDRVDIVLWVTLGSPLGIDEIQERIAQPLQTPVNVRRWVNFADPLDPIAQDKTLGDVFAPQGGVRAEDNLIVNPFTRQLQDFNPHHSLGYLGHSLVREAVLQHVPVNFASPTRTSVIAQDLATEMSNTNERIHVLIEVRMDDHQHPTGLSAAAKRRGIEEGLKQIIDDEGISPADRERAAQAMEIDHLQSYVAAMLTPYQIMLLGRRRRELQIFRVWRNSEKKTLLFVSARKIHADRDREDSTASGKDIGWAVLDTGVNDRHPHFQTYDSIAGQWDCTMAGPLQPGAAFDGNGHGTHVAGIIAGAQSPAPDDPDLRHVGIAPRARLHIYKVLRDDGGGRDSFIIKALDHIAETNETAGMLVVHGVNLSLGGSFDPVAYGCGHSPICNELRRLWRMGVVVCLAAGNEGQRVVNVQGEGPTPLNLSLSIGDPANLDEAIAVGSVHRDNPYLYGVSHFSSRGPTADGRSKPDVVAPGEKISSCNAKFESSGEPPYLELSGTSMACPHVSGLIAAFLSDQKEFRGQPDKVKKILLAHCMDLERNPLHQGAGMPNLAQMLLNT